MRTRIGKVLLLAPLVLIGFLLFVTIGGVIVQQLWNWLLPSLFGWPRLSFWQALGILALCRILFGGFGGHGSPGSRIRRRIGERMEHLPPEERSRIRQRMRERFGLADTAGEGRTSDAAARGE